MNGEKVCELKCKYNLSGICTCYGLCIAKDLIKEELEEKKFWKEINVNDLIVEELEKIKAELNNLDFDFGNYYDETEAILNKINSVLDNHIKENKQ